MAGEPDRAPGLLVGVLANATRDLKAWLLHDSDVVPLHELVRGPKVGRAVAFSGRRASERGSSLSCMATIAASWSERLIRRGCLLLVQRDFSGQSAHLVVQ